MQTDGGVAALVLRLALGVMILGSGAASLDAAIASRGV
jgi:hypothetical protein